MPLDPGAKRFLQLLAAGRPAGLPGPSVEERRTGLAQLMAFSGPLAEMALTEDRQIPGPQGWLRLRLYMPQGRSADRANAGCRPLPPPGARHALGPGLLYFHGGGLVAGSLDTHDRLARSLAQAGRCCVVSVDYRLAPEFPFPAAVDDAIAAYRHVSAHAEDFGIDRSRLGVGGDSAGATLATVVCQAVARSDLTRPAMQLLLCPILDHAGMTESRRLYAKGYFLDQATLDDDVRHYVATGRDLEDPRISPLRAPEVHGLPPTLIHSAQCDPLRDEAAHYAQRLQAAGVPVTLTCHAGMIHLFYALAGVIPAAKAAVEAIGTELQALLCKD